MSQLLKGLYFFLWSHLNHFCPILFNTHPLNPYVGLHMYTITNTKTPKVVENLCMLRSPRRKKKTYS